MHAHMVRRQLQYLTWSKVAPGLPQTVRQQALQLRAACTFSRHGVAAGLPPGSSLSYLLHLVGAAASSAAVRSAAKSAVLTLSVRCRQLKATATLLL